MNVILENPQLQTRATLVPDSGRVFFFGRATDKVRVVEELEECVENEESCIFKNLAPWITLLSWIIDFPVSKRIRTPFSGPICTNEEATTLKQWSIGLPPGRVATNLTPPTRANMEDLSASCGLLRARVPPPVVRLEPTLILILRFPRLITGVNGQSRREFLVVSQCLDLEKSSAAS